MKCTQSIDLNKKRFVTQKVLVSDKFCWSLSQLFIPDMSDTEKTNQNLQESILDESKNDFSEDLADDDVVRITKVIPGQRAGSISIYWRQRSLSFRGFARNRSKKKPEEFTIHCFRNTSHKGKPCHFSFKAECTFDRSTDDFFTAENWVVLGENKKNHLGISADEKDVQGRLTLTSTF